MLLSGVGEVLSSGVYVFPFSLPLPLCRVGFSAAGGACGLFHPCMSMCRAVVGGGAGGAPLPICKAFPWLESAFFFLPAPWVGVAAVSIGVRRLPWPCPRVGRARRGRRGVAHTFRNLPLGRTVAVVLTRLCLRRVSSCRRSEILPLALPLCPKGQFTSDVRR